MSEILQFNRPNRIRTREQASVWLTRMQEPMSAEQQDELVAWLAVDDAHGEQLLELASVWDELEVLTELAPLFEELSLPLLEQLDAGPNVSVNCTQKNLWLRPLIAACLLFFIGGYWANQTTQFNFESLVWLTQNEKMERSSLAQEASRETEPGFETFKTEVGEYRALTLSDGSIVTLNTDTKIEVGFSETLRMVRLLNGEAHFEVIKDSMRPLKVMVSGKSVEALGTAFSVRKKSDTDIEVAVDQGLVAVYQLMSSQSELVEPALKASLGAGDVLSIDEQRSELNEYDIDEMEDRLAWRKGMIVINDETLNHVIKEFSRYNEKNILLADRAMGKIRVAGYFNLGDMDALLVALERNFKIRSEFYQHNNTFVLSQIAEPTKEIR